MATRNEEHIEGLDAYKKHVKHSSGCIMRCTSAYEVGKAHSHRWQAARRARGENRIPYNNYELVARKLIYGSEDRLKRAGAINITHDVGDRYAGEAKAFTTEDNPFFHNAHHIIPVGVLIKCILKTAGNAKPNANRMENIIVRGLLTEPYNINKKPNMIVLPTEPAPALVLGLPLHLEGSRDHPVYSRMIKGRTLPKFVSKYKSLADEVSAEKHGQFQKRTAPTLRPSLEEISNAMYEAIIGLAMSRKFVGESLDSVSHALVCRFARIYSG